MLKLKFSWTFLQSWKPSAVLWHDIDSYNAHVHLSNISRTTKGTLHKVLQHYLWHGTIQPVTCDSKRSKKIFLINHIHVEIMHASCNLIGSQQHWFQTKLHDYRFCTLSASRNPFKCFFNLARAGFNWHKRKDFLHFSVFVSKRCQNKYD